MLSSNIRLDPLQETADSAAVGTDEKVIKRIHYINYNNNNNKKIT